MKQTLSIILLSASCCFAGVKLDDKQNKIPGFRLQLEEEMYLSDSFGVLLPKQIMSAALGRMVRIYKTDGGYYQGRVTEIVTDDTSYKVYGVINNVDGAKFGFVLSKEGVFAGAVVETKNENVYAVEFSEAHKGYVLLKTHKYDRPGS